MRRVVIVQRRLTHYRAPLFEIMRASLAGMNVELQVFYGEGSPQEGLKGDAAHLPWARKVRNSYFGLLGRSLCWQSISWAHVRADLVIIPQEMSFVSTFFILFIRGMLGKKTALWGHGANLNVAGRSALGEAIKRVISRRASWWFAYTDMTLRIVTALGYPAARVTVLNNSIDTGALKRQMASLPEADRATIRANFALSPGRTAIFLGSLYSEKRVDVLLAAAELLSEADPKFRLLIVGDGPQRELVKQFCEKNTWCHWLGSRTGSDKALFLSVSDVMLCPGLVGLVVLDAFVAGLPLVTMENASHPPEAAYLVAGRNCVQSAPDIHEYFKAANAVLSDRGLRHSLSQECLAASEHFTLENMADRFCRGIISALS